MYDPFANYDAWLQHDPAMDGPDEPPIYNCQECGRFLKHEPDSSEQVDNLRECEDITGEIYIEDWSFTRLHRVCPNCGTDNLEDFL